MTETLPIVPTVTGWLPALLLGLAVGLIVGMLFFASLAWSIRRSLQSRHPARWLLAGFLLRSGLLIVPGLWLCWRVHPTWAPAAFLLAFFAVRVIAVRRARGRLAATPSGWTKDGRE